ncbi:MAG: porin [Candidatus Thiodiazotropha sp. (ex Ctena orbiculata)]|nr:porin [Candidatus Thiodiazotropha taylori]
MKKVLSLAIAAALVAPAAAMADATIYGKVRQSIDIVDFSDAGGDDEIQINNRTSRLGVKGSEDLGNGLTGVYKIEYGVNISTNNGGNEFSGSGALGARNAFVGLAGGFGTVVLGRHDTPLKISTGSLDYFGDTAVDNNLGYTEDLLDLRADGTLAYISPAMGGLTAAIALVPGENTTSVEGEEADGLTDAYSLALMYSNFGVFASVALEVATPETTVHPVVGGDGDDHENVRVGLGYKHDMFKVGMIYDTIENGVDDSQSLMVNGSVKAGPGNFKAKYFKVDSDDSTSNLFRTGSHDGFGFGYDYNLSKRTQVAAYYVTSEMDDSGDESSVVSFQVNHNF